MLSNHFIAHKVVVCLVTKSEKLTFCTIWIYYFIFDMIINIVKLKLGFDLSMWFYFG